MIERSGYKLVYTDKPNRYDQAYESTGKSVNSWYDVGLQMSDKGEIQDVREGSSAWNDGLGIGMTVVAVNDRDFTADAWDAAVKATSASLAPLRLIVEQDGYYRDITLHYHGGAKYPHLVRIKGTTDMLTLIMQRHAK